MTTFFRRALFLIAVIALPLVSLAAESTTATQFVPLTSLPGLSDFTSSTDLQAFLNNIYKICIGAAAALAVFQIMRAGFYFMTNKGSVSENEQAKHLLQMSIFGLLLVLSPVIVFGIINPKILSLDFNTSALKVPDGVADAATAAVTKWTTPTKDPAAEKAKCEAEGGTTIFTCNKTGVAPRVISMTEACASDETEYTTCQAKGETLGVTGTCSDYTVAASPTGICNGANGYTHINSACCGTGLAEGAVCCGKKKPTENELRAQVIVAQVLTICSVPADTSEKLCLEQHALTAAQNYATCFAAAGTNAAALGACGEKAKAEGKAAAVCLSPAPTAAQITCMETAIYNGIVQNG